MPRQDLKQSIREEKRVNTYMRISVVIPTLNRGEPLQTCLEALNIDFPPDAEVIVVSDGGDRKSFPDLQKFRKKLNLKVIHAEHGGPASARNHGLQVVNAPVVLFLDDDCLPDPGWVESMAAAVKLDPLVAAGGKTLNGLPDNLYAVTAQLILDLVERDRKTRKYPVFFFPSNNIAFPTHALRQLGGFDVNYRTSEDRELCRRWQQAGHQLVHTPDGLLRHAPDLSFSRFWKKYSSYGEGAALFHENSNEDWGLTFAYHTRIPSLLTAEFRQSRPARRLGISLLILVWEFANLVGYIKGRFN
jgi:GT2 family glycosyltransferase